jgi:TolA-binding protein
MVRKYLPIIFLFSCSLLTTSCFWFTPKDEGRQLRQDVQHLQDRFAQIESELEEEQAHLKDMIDHARTEVAKLEETLTRATRVLARNSADFGAEMETVTERMREVDGTLAEIRHELDETARSIGTTNKRVSDFAMAAGLDMPVDPSTVPKKSSDHFEMIKDALAAGRFGEVRSLSKVFLERHAKDGAADDVQLLFAKSYYEQKRWARSLGALRRHTDKYPKSEHTPEVLYLMANSFYNLGDCTDARILVEAITTRHKKSPFVARAKQLNDKMADKKSRCTS